MPPLRNLRGWLDELGTHAEPVRAAYAEWPATTSPTLFSPEEASAMVERFAGIRTQEAQEAQEESMVVYTVAEDKVRRRMGRIRREGMEQQRTLLRGMAARRFGAETAARLAPAPRRHPRQRWAGAGRRVDRRLRRRRGVDRAVRRWCRRRSLTPESRTVARSPRGQYLPPSNLVTTRQRTVRTATPTVD